MNRILREEFVRIYSEPVPQFRERGSCEVDIALFDERTELRLQASMEGWNDACDLLRTANISGMPVEINSIRP